MTLPKYLFSAIILCYACLLDVSFVSSVTTEVTFPRHPCPSVLGCICEDDDVTRLVCLSVGPSTVYDIRSSYPNVRSVHITYWRGSVLNLSLFEDLDRLETLSVVDGYVDDVRSDLARPLPSLNTLNLTGNKLYSWRQMCDLSVAYPSVRSLWLSNNRFDVISDCVRSMNVANLGVQKNRDEGPNTPVNYAMYSEFDKNKLLDLLFREKLERKLLFGDQLNLTELWLVNGTIPSGLRSLFLSGNRLRKFHDVPKSLRTLNISSNPLRSLNLPRMPWLRSLDLSETKLRMAPTLDAQLLEEFYMDRSALEVIHLSSWNTPKLKKLSLVDSRALVSFTGSLPARVNKLSLTGSNLVALPLDVFDKSIMFRSSMTAVELSNNHFSCEPCALQWAYPIRTIIKQGEISCPLPHKRPQNCTLGVIPWDPDTVSQVYAKPAVLPCSVYGHPSPAIEWWLFRPSSYLGKYDPVTKTITPGNASDAIANRYELLSGGALQILTATSDVVERYVCVARAPSGNTSYGIVHFRLDYHSWYSLDLFHSVFWGGMAAAILISILSFLLNITWILTRKSILWWINRAERLSRVRKMVEAMEKYRARQMESLQDKYQRRMQLVRDNYHEQVEQLRGSYAAQSDRFRDYRVAQMESMTSHLENIRENYNQQMQRVREYGSRRAEQLWESYDRQVNRMRTFSLQHRLKMMRQYKVKHRYVNKLLESFQDVHSPESLRKHEEDVRAALELPEPDVVCDDEGSLAAALGMSPMAGRLSRSSSFYSLPEYILGQDGVLRPSPLIPSVRYTARDLIPSGPSTSRDITAHFSPGMNVTSRSEPKPGTSSGL